MGGKSKAPPPPDFSAIAAASERAAQMSYQLGMEQLRWAKQQYAQDRELADKVIASALRTQDINEKNAAEDRAFYIKNYRPLEQDLVNDAASYASGDRKINEAGRAASAVSQQFDQARNAAAQNLEAFGVDPTSTRYAALDVGMRTQQAAAAAAAQNQSIQNTENTGRALRSEAINVGRGYPGQVAATYGTSLQAGNAAVNSGLATTASGANSMGTAPQWMGTGNQALGIWGNTLNMGYQNQLAAFNANNNQSSGWGGVAGALIGGAMRFMEDGGPVDEDDVSIGGNVPPEASPTRGAAIDDVPARLTPGEFVVPKDVVAWKGEEYFQKLIEGSRKAKDVAPAKPKIGLAPPERPTFQSRAAALPTE